MLTHHRATADLRDGGVCVRGGASFRFRNALFLALLGTLMIPFQVTIIPNFILFRWLGLYGTQAPLVAARLLGGAFGTFLLRQYFLTIPIDLAEAARVDGASLLRIFWRIYLPLARPALAALAIFVFLQSWNNLLTPLIYLPSDLTANDAAGRIVAVPAAVRRTLDDHDGGGAGQHRADHSGVLLRSAPVHRGHRAQRGEVLEAVFSR